MITISAPCSFAAYNSETKKLESSIITITENTTISCNQDELKVSNKNTIFTATRAELIVALNNLLITNDDGTAITEEII